jgi:heme/copper-type cytochrome/quinol oxidase subunit 2
MTARLALFWAAVAVCLIAELAILRSLLFGRARAAEQSATGPLSDAIRERRPAEIAWAILPAVGLLFVLYLTWRAVDAPAAPAAEVIRTGAMFGA